MTKHYRSQRQKEIRRHYAEKLQQGYEYLTTTTRERAEEIIGKLKPGTDIFIAVRGFSERGIRNTNLRTILLKDAEEVSV